MAEQPLKNQCIHTRFEQMGGETVPQTMDSASLGQSHMFHRRGKGPLHGVLGDMAIGIDFAGKQPVLRSVEAPVGSQLHQKPRRKQRIPILLAFALDDMNLVPLTEQITNPQLTDLADAQAGGIRGHEYGSVFAIEIRASQESLQLLHTVDPGAQDGLFHSRQGVFNGSGWAMEHLPVEKTQSADCDDDGTDGQLSDPQEMQKVFLNLVIRDLIGRTVVEPG